MAKKTPQQVIPGGMSSWNSKSGGEQRTNFKLLKSLSDFPTPVGDVITLEDGIAYSVSGNIDISPNRIVVNGADNISGSSATHDGITTSNTGALFTVTSGILRLRSISLSGGGSMLDVTSPSSSGVNFITECLVNDFPSGLGSLVDFPIFFLGSVLFTNVTGGFSLSTTSPAGPATPFFIADTVSLTLSTGTFIDLGTSALAGVTIENSPTLFAASGSTVLSGLANSGNFVNGFAGIKNNVFVGAGDYINNITNLDLRWDFQGNRGGKGTEDTHSDSYIYIASGDEAATSIGIGDGDNGNPKIINGTFTSEISDRFTNTAAGRMTYIGIEDSSFMVSANFSAQPSSGSNKDYSFYIALNGAVITASRGTRNLDSVNPQGVSLSANIAMSTNDFVEMFVENNSDTTNITVSGASFSIS